MIVLPGWSSLGVFIAAALALLITPGPAVLYIVGQSVAHGRAGTQLVDAGGGPDSILPRLRGLIQAKSLVECRYCVRTSLSQCLHRAPAHCRSRIV